MGGFVATKDPFRRGLVGWLVVKFVREFRVFFGFKSQGMDEFCPFLACLELRIELVRSIGLGVIRIQAKQIKQIQTMPKKNNNIKLPAMKHINKEALYSFKERYQHHSSQHSLSN